jgi:hypothetical protein
MAILVVGIMADIWTKEKTQSGNAEGEISRELHNGGEAAYAVS